MKFSSTNYSATPGALAAIADADKNAVQFLRRHTSGDWGEVSEADAKLNEDALLSGERLLSAYRTTKGVRLWVITEAVGDDGRRPVTTIILPEEY
jgi:hypothetical protein